MIQFRKNSYANRVLEAIALCGEFPYKSLEIICGNKIMTQRAVLDLKKEGYIGVSGSGVMKTMRLKKKSFEVLDAINPNYIEHYMYVSENHHFRGGKYKNDNVGARQTWRRHRMAEILCLLKNIGVKVWKYQKPKLSLEDHTDNLDINSPIFFTSKELKNTDVEQRYKTEFTRIMGALISPGGIYCIYNTNKGLIKWSSQGERKAQVLVEDIVNMNSKESSFTADNAIMFGKDMQTALDILQSNGGKKDVNGFELLSFDNTYSNIYYITMDDIGKRQLKIMMTPNWHDIMKKAIFDEEYINFSYSSVDCDAINGNKYILMFFDGNIGRLRRFKQASYDGDCEFEVICFPHQQYIVSEYMGENVSVRTLLIDDIEKIF